MEGQEQQALEVKWDQQVSLEQQELLVDLDLQEIRDLLVELDQQVRPKNLIYWAFHFLGIYV